MLTTCRRLLSILAYPLSSSFVRFIDTSSCIAIHLVLNIMDPISTFALALNTLAVVDFSKTFFEVLGQVRDAGSPAAMQDIIGTARSLKASNKKIKDQSWIAVDNRVGFLLNALPP